jgi:glycosyltransferase involved in cell wall biosynthesis
MKPLVSILIPAFNAQEWVAETLRSATAQTWEQCEIIVVDDGSRDQTVAIAREFESSRVRVVTQENQGAAAARNKAFSLCQGDYVQWLDADDLLAPDKIARQMEAVDGRVSKKTLLSSEWGRFLYRPWRAKFSPTELWCDLSPKEWLLRKMALNIFMQTSTWLVSRELTEAAGPWNTKLLGDDDGEYFCRVLLASDGVRFVPNARVYYRESGAGSLSDLGRSKKKADALWHSMQLHMSYLQSLEKSARVNLACLKYLEVGLGRFYANRPDIVEQLNRTALDLGERLELPRLSWKYSWIRSLFGERLARRAEALLPRIKLSAVRRWDAMMFRVEKLGFLFGKMEQGS